MNRFQKQRGAVTMHSRNALLAARPEPQQVSHEVSLQARVWRGAEGLQPKATNCVQDPRLDDEWLLAKMEERLDKETGADVKNRETFGEDSGKWTYEEAAATNDWLNGTLVKPYIVKDCASTAPGSRSHSNPPSSERSSTPRSPAAALAVSGLSADAAPFSPATPMHTLGLSAGAAPFLPAAPIHTMGFSAHAAPFLPAAPIHTLAPTAPPPPPPGHRGPYTAYGHLMDAAPGHISYNAKMMTKGLATSPPITASATGALRSRRQSLVQPRF